MDAQDITFNQDPEAAASDLPEQPKRKRCRFLRWYLAPITSEICHTFKCFLFHPLNFAASIFLLVWDVTMLSVGIGIIPLCCMGIPLLWVSMEFIIVWSRLDLGLHYHMVEDGKNLDEDRAHLLSLSLYFTDIPLCCCYNRGQNCVNLMFERMKYLFTSLEMYKYILYQVFVRPFFAFATWGMCIVVACNVALCGVIFWYAAMPDYFHDNKVIIGWAADCTTVDNSTVCSRNWSFIINSFVRVFLLFISSLLVLPLTMRFSNWLAYINKVIAYRFYTFYFTKDPDQIRDKAPILKDYNQVRVNSV